MKKSDAGTVIVLLGEVDTGFVIWYRTEKYQASVSEMLGTALAELPGVPDAPDEPRAYMDMMIPRLREHL